MSFFFLYFFFFSLRRKRVKVVATPLRARVPWPVRDFLKHLPQHPRRHRDDARVTAEAKPAPLRWRNRTADALADVEDQVSGRHHFALQLEVMSLWQEALPAPRVANGRFPDGGVHGGGGLSFCLVDLPRMMLEASGARIFFGKFVPKLKVLNF
jgi:hypothetical protein